MTITPDGREPLRREILVVDDDPELLRVIDRTLRGAGYAVRTAADAESALLRVREASPQLLITDLMLPGMDGIELLREARALAPGVEVLLITAHATLERAVEAMRQGAHDFLEKPFERDRLLLAVERALEKQALTVENRALRERLKDHAAAAQLVGAGRAMVELRRLVAQIAASDVPVLVTGESGSGKEVVADLLHELSVRRQAPMIKISCAAIPETLLESELFGYEKGAFSGAHQTKRGRFELADHGTLFLDEIGEMAPAMQAKLLRVLQDGRVQRLGGTRDPQVDVRLITATNVDLSRAMRDERFREDLYHRISVIEIPVPALRERLEDLPLLVAHFLALHAGLRTSPLEGVSDAALVAMSHHPWPGNVRELENVIQRALVTAPGPVLRVSDLRFASYVGHAAGLSGGSGGGGKDAISIPAGTRLDEVEEIFIADALVRSRGDKEKAARMLGISARTLYRRVSRGEDAGDAGGSGAPTG
ncbi:MAG: sigma-54 dependent transcriptional regulator [Candidatus Eisenbacteria bacterium]